MKGDRRTILLTGASGFIGVALARAMLARGWRVVGVGRANAPIDDPAFEWRRLDLAADDLPADLFTNVDVLIHGALLRPGAAAGAFTSNLRAAANLLDAAIGNGVAEALFISSMAADGDALSQYGQQKYAIERMFLERGFFCVRPGLVIGNGGLFHALATYLAKHAYVPLIDGGRQSLETIYIDDCVEMLVDALQKPLPNGVYAVAAEQPIAYRRLCLLLAQHLSVKPIFVPVPFFIANLGLSVAQMLHVPLPIDRDNLLGLRGMKPTPIERLTSPHGRPLDAEQSIVATLASRTT